MEVSIREVFRKRVTSERFQRTNGSFPGRGAERENELPMQNWKNQNAYRKIQDFRKVEIERMYQEVVDHEEVTEPRP